MEEDNKAMLKIRKPYLKPSVKTFNSPSNIWPLGVAAASAVGSAVGVALGLFGSKDDISSRSKRSLQHS